MGTVSKPLQNKLLVSVALLRAYIRSRFTSKKAFASFFVLSSVHVLLEGKKMAAPLPSFSLHIIFSTLCHKTVLSLPRHLYFSHINNHFQNLKVFFVAR